MNPDKLDNIMRAAQNASHYYSFVGDANYPAGRESFEDAVRAATKAPETHGLSDEEISQAWATMPKHHSIVQFARTIEAEVLRRSTSGISQESPQESSL